MEFIRGRYPYKHAKFILGDDFVPIPTLDSVHDNFFHVVGIGAARVYLSMVKLNYHRVPTPLHLIGSRDIFLCPVRFVSEFIG